MTLAQVPIPSTFFGNQPGAWNGGTGIGSSPGSFISALLPNIIVVAGVVFFFLIVGAGFSLIVKAGGQKSPQDTAKAKAALTWAVVGFLLVVASYFILQIIQTILGIDITSAPPL